MHVDAHVVVTTYDTGTDVLTRVTHDTNTYTHIYVLECNIYSIAYTYSSASYIYYMYIPTLSLKNFRLNKRALRVEKKITHLNVHLMSVT